MRREGWYKVFNKKTREHEFALLRDGWKFISAAIDPEFIGKHYLLPANSTPPINVNDADLCEWSLDSHDAFATSCGEYKCALDGTLAENSIIFCSTCGKRILEIGADD